MIHRAPISFPGGPTPGARPRASAFTLLELLVVLALLLGALRALLLPTLAAGRDYAKVAACLSNTRQLGMAWTMYFNDSDDSFPMWSRNVQWFYGGTDPALYNPLYQYPTRPLNPYVGLELEDSRGLTVFQCPADRDIRSGITGKTHTQGHDTYTFYGNSYMLNTTLVPRVLNKESPYYGRSITLQDFQISHSRLILLGDVQWYYTVFNAHWDAKFHNTDRSLPLAFVDGHAKHTPMTRGETITDDYSLSFLKPLPAEEGT
ncbi:MAG: hypothetical protein AAF078_12345 [Planctomycetota bacterium]